MIFRNSDKKLFRRGQQSNYGGWDTFGRCSHGGKNRTSNNKKARRRMREYDKFYQGFDLFLECDNKDNFDYEYCMKYGNCKYCPKNGKGPCK